MLPLVDPRWEAIDPHSDVRDLLRTLEAGEGLLPLQGWKGESDRFWELFEAVFHQYDVGLHSYASVPHVVSIFRKNGWFDWRVFYFVGAVENARQLTWKDNPFLPVWLEIEYRAAIHDLFLWGCENSHLAWNELLKWNFLTVAASALNLPGHSLLLSQINGNDKTAREIVDEFQAW